jgi:ADP-ribose pyrophosphatase
MKKWEKLSEEILHKNPWWTYKHEKYVLPNGKEGDYYYMHTNGGASIIPVLDDGRIIMTKQWRYLFKRENIEFPIGGLKENQSYEEAARTELEEEVGYKIGELSLIGEMSSCKGLVDELIKVFLAKNLKKTKSHPDETEEIEILLKTPEEIDKMIETNEIWDGQVLAAWALARKYFIK